MSAAEGFREAELVARFRASRNPRWFDELYRLTRRSVYGIAYHYLRNAQQAEDICHDAFTRAFERFDQLRGEQFSAWINRIVTHMALNEIRNRITRERKLAEFSGSVEPAPAAERVAEASEQLARVLRILHALPYQQRLCLLLVHLEGMSYRQIAELTGLELNQVRSHIQNARRTLKRKWQDPTIDGPEVSHV